MATKSIVKTVDIRDRRLTKGFVDALESASKKKSKAVIISKAVKKASEKEISAILERYK